MVKPRPKTRCLIEWYGTMSRNMFMLGCLNDTLLKPVYIMELYISISETLLHWEYLNPFELSLELTPDYVTQL